MTNPLNMNCKNCNTELSLNYCPQCGRPAKLHRIDGHYILHEIEHILHFERGILFTIRELLLRPGKSIKEFVSDDRGRLVKPIIFIIITSLIYTLTVNLFHIEDKYVEFSAPDMPFTTKMFEWIENHYGYANILMAVFIAFWLKKFFKKYDYNFFEILIMLCFVMGMGMLLIAILSILIKIAPEFVKQIASAIIFIYMTWAIGQFFDAKQWQSYFKTFFAYMLGMLTFTLVMLLIGIPIDLLMKP